MMLAVVLQHAAERHHPIVEALEGATGWWLFSSAVATMPVPLPMERWYRWFWSFLQVVAANHDLRRKLTESDLSENLK